MPTMSTITMSNVPHVFTGSQVPQEASRALPHLSFMTAPQYCSSYFHLTEDTSAVERLQSPQLLTVSKRPSPMMGHDWHQQGQGLQKPVPSARGREGPVAPALSLQMSLHCG